MAVPKSFKTEKGTELPLTNLKGKPYLMVAHRLVWLDEKYSNYTIETNFLKLEENYAVAAAKITLFNADGTVARTSSATKHENGKSFPDFIEKAETGAIGRALAMVGIGTQFCEPDLDEENRLADSPVTLAKKEKPAVATETKTTTASFNKNVSVETKKVEEDNGWS